MTAMATFRKTSRQSITLPPPLAKHVRRLAKNRNLSANQVVIELIAEAIQAREREKERFMALAEELAASKDVRRQHEIKKELARLTFGE